MILINPNEFLIPGRNDRQNNAELGHFEILLMVPIYKGIVKMGVRLAGRAILT